MNTVVSLATGVAKQLDGKNQPDEIISPEDAADDSKLARLLTRILKSVAALQRAYIPRTVTFRDVVTTGTNVAPQTLRLTHNFSSPVDWYAVRIASPVSTTTPFLVEAPGTDGASLVLLAYFSATLSIRVSEAG